jgi:hypothetical protein
MVEVLNEVGDDMRAKIRTTEFTSKLHLVDLAGGRTGRDGEGSYPSSFNQVVAVDWPALIVSHRCVPRKCL